LLSVRQKICYMRKSIPITLLFIIGCLIQFSGCYSFKGITIQPETKTFYVAQFDNNARTLVPTLPQDFTEKLKRKLLDETRLNFNNTNPDIEFSGSITQYRISSEAPAPGEISAISRLTIQVAVDYVNNKDEDDKWKQNFTFFQDYPSDQNILDLQDELIDAISDQLVEDIFQKAFTNW